MDLCFETVCANYSIKNDELYYSFCTNSKSLLASLLLLLSSLWSCLSPSLPSLPSPSPSLPRSSGKTVNIIQLFLLALLLLNTERRETWSQVILNTSEQVFTKNICRRKIHYQTEVEIFEWRWRGLKRQARWQDAINNSFSRDATTEILLNQYLRNNFKARLGANKTNSFKLCQTSDFMETQSRVSELAVSKADTELGH